MIIDVKSILYNNNQMFPLSTGGRPMLNDHTRLNTSAYLTQQPENYPKIIRTIRQSPEALGIFNAIATDIASDGFQFIPAKKQGSKSNIDKAMKFVMDNQFTAQFKAGLLDWLMLGNCCFWLGVTNVEAKEFLSGKKNTLEFKEDFIDEQVNNLRTFQQVPWSTMFIEFDDTEILNYVQNAVGVTDHFVNNLGRPIEGRRSGVSEGVRKWKPDSIIHGKFMSFDGKVYGFTPTFSLSRVLDTQIALKDYLGNYFFNGGVPDWMFILPNEVAGSPNVTRLEQMLQDYKRSTQKSGNMIIPGAVEAKPLNEFNKDMEFRSLAVYYTAILAFSFGMPMGRIQAILGLEVKGKESDMSQESYWRTISESQDYFEQLFNSQLFIPTFGVKIKFKKTYKQDEIRESQNLLFLADYTEKMNKILALDNEKLSSPYVRKIFKLEETDVRSISEEEKEEIMSIGEKGTNRDEQMANEDLTGNDAQTRKDKQKEQKQAMDRKKLDTKEKQDSIDVAIKEKEIALITKKEKMLENMEKELKKANEE